jgi:hypothetical protein
LDTLNSTMYCRLPFDESSEGKMCSAHGLLNIQTATSSRTIFKPIGPICDDIIVTYNDTVNTYTLQAQ